MENIELEFTGERFVPGRSGERIEADHMERYKFARQFVKEKNILDIACGSGYSAPLMIEGGAESYQGVDISEHAVEHANHIYGSEKINYDVGDIATFDNGIQYDVITCFETIEHIENYEPAIANLYSILQKGGVLLLSSPFRPVTSPNAKTINDKPSNKFHTQEFTPEELIFLLKKYGCSVDGESVFGQRQRKHYSVKLLRKLASALYGNPNKVSSPVVEKINCNMAPKYFLIVARKM